MIGARCCPSAITCAASRACNVRAQEFDLICLGSGPAGQKAAIQAAKAGFRACIVEREPQVGGSCLLSGTIPSRALREQALRYRRMRGSATSLAVELRGDAPLSALLHGVDAVIAAQDAFLMAQLVRNGVELIRGKGVFLDAHRIEVQHLGTCLPSKSTMNTLSTAIRF
jgi:NAD(P) transhydrogenase